MMTPETHEYTNGFDNNQIKIKLRGL
jgi:hypothetical protein